MVVMDERPELKVRAEYQAELQVERTEILFHNLDRDRVQIQVTVRNIGEQRSQPTTMRLESAPLGAFVPWQPLTQLRVPALEPGESRELSTEAVRPHPTPLGNFNHVPPKRLVTAATSTDEQPQSNSGIVGLLDLLLKRQGPSRKDLAGKPSLAPDLWDLVGRGQPHWAGNLNVFIGNKPVERHMAMALRVHPGRTNLAMFLVGEQGKRDAYAFELVGLASDWKAGLYDMKNNGSLVLNSADVAIEEMQWVKSDAGLMVLLATHPPADCQEGNLEVHVTRRSCGKTAMVEFNLNPAAQGPGCYVL